MVITQRETKQFRRRQIINAARKLIIKHGSEHVTVRKMANEIGVTEGAVYRYFISKKQILNFLLDDIQNSLISNISCTEQPRSDSLQRLKTVLDNEVSEIKQKKGMSFQVIAEIIRLGDKKLNKKAYQVIEEFIGLIRQILKEGMDAGQIKVDIDASSIAVLIFGLMQGLATMWTLNHYSVDLEKDYQSLWTFFSASISNNRVIDKTCMAS